MDVFQDLKTGRDTFVVKKGTIILSFVRRPPLGEVIYISDTCDHLSES
jgi:hypothetical protein